eukprot:2734830-Prymnesium_polylepis.2
MIVCAAPFSKVEASDASSSHRSRPRSDHVRVPRPRNMVMVARYTHETQGLAGVPRNRRDYYDRAYSRRLVASDSK